MRDAEEIKEWLKKAEEDFAGALHLYRKRTKPLPDLVCFHCQQTAEKYLKALLIFHEVVFPKTHDLVSLLELCVQFQPEIELLREPMELLNPYSVRFRYPGEESSKEDAKRAIKATKSIMQVLREYFPTELRSASES